MTPDPPQRPTARLIWLGWAYAALLAAALGVRFGIGDPSPVPFALNALLFYFFLPLPLLLLAGIAHGRRDLLLIFAGGAAIWIYLWGGLFVPRAPPATIGRTLVVLSYNVFGYNFDTGRTLRVIRDSAADVVCLTELNPDQAQAIEQQLAVQYPHRWLEPKSGVRGAGILSKYPFDRIESQPLGELDWLGEPMLVEVSIGSRRVTVGGFHAASGTDAVQRRAQQASALAEYARQRPGPLVLAGDLNATDQNAAYAVVTRELRDAWREAGRGFGHTFPGPGFVSPRDARSALIGALVPPWLLRIDYVFHSDELEAVDVRLSASDGGSDHRGLIAIFVLR